jgi:hypothetical protein
VPVELDSQRRHHVDWRRLTSVGIVSPSVDVCLQMLSVRKLSLVLLLLLLVPLLLGLVEVTEVTLPVIKSLRVLMDDIGSNRVKERSVVRPICQLIF